MIKKTSMKISTKSSCLVWKRMLLVTSATEMNTASLTWNSCNLDLEQCSADGGKLPTLCPSNSVSSNARSDCEDSGDCSSNRCEFHSNPVWAALGYGQCYDRLGATAWCNEHSDCSSNYCNTFFTCANKKYNGARCLVNGDCHSNNCNWWFKCKWWLF